MENVKMFGNGDYQFEVGKSKTIIVSSTDECPGEDEISFCISHGEELLNSDNQPIAINMAKQNAIDLAIHLLKISTDDVPGNGAILDVYQEYDVSVHQAKEDDGTLANEPIICIDNIEPEDIAGDGCISICIGNESAKNLISIFAKIV